MENTDNRKTLSQIRSEQAIRDRIAQQQRNAEHAKQSRERRKNTEEYKVIVQDGPNRTSYSCSTEPEAIEKVKEVANYNKNSYIRLYAKIVHCVGYSRKTIHEYGIQGQEINVIK